MRETTDMRVLPIEGLVLRDFVVEGNRKDAEVNVVASDGRRFVFATSASELEITVQGTVLTEVTGSGDNSLRVRYTADHLALREARIQYPGTPERWEEDLDRFNDGRRMSWVIQEGSFTLVGENKH